MCVLAMRQRAFHLFYLFAVSWGMVGIYLNNSINATRSSGFPNSLPFYIALWSVNRNALQTSTLHTYNHLLPFTLLAPHLNCQQHPLPYISIILGHVHETIGQKQQENIATCTGTLWKTTHPAEWNEKTHLNFTIPPTPINFFVDLFTDIH